MITGKSIRSLGRHTRGHAQGARLIAALTADEEVTDRLLTAGFTVPLAIGQQVLPSVELGKCAQYNAEGREIVHKDQPMETVYHQVLWTHEEWRGRYTDTVTSIIDRGYQRYPRTFEPPLGVELTAKRGNNGDLLVCAPPYILGEEDDHLLHAINLVLSIDSRCELLTEDLVPAIPTPLRKLNWTVLPPGRHPWAQLRLNVAELLARSDDAARPIIEHRLEHISQFEHDFVAVGRAGFAGYVVFGFQKKGIFVLESTREGNATYVFGQDWATLSQMTKAEILDEHLQEDRLIHVRGWDNRIGEVIHGRGIQRGGARLARAAGR
jgi:hypothetical protein